MKEKEQVIRMNICKVVQLKSSFVQNIKKWLDIPQSIILLTSDQDQYKDNPNKIEGNKNVFFCLVEDIKEARKKNNVVYYLKIKNKDKMIVLNENFHMKPEDIYSVIDWNSSPIDIPFDEKIKILEKIKEITNEDNVNEYNISIKKLSK